MREWIGEGRTEEDAAARGLAALGLTRDRADVRVLGERSSGLLSLMGFRRVKVRVAEKAGRFPPRLQRDDEGQRDRSAARPAGRERAVRPEEWNRRRDPERRDADRRRTEERSPDRRADRGKKSPERPPRTAEGKGDRRRGPREDQSRGRHVDAPRREIEKAPSLSTPRAGEPADTGRPNRPPVDVEILLGEWKGLLGWEDLAWEIQPPADRRVTVTLTTSRAEQLAGRGGRSLQAFEYLFNLVSSGGDRERPWVSFRFEGFATTDEQRIADQALFAAFQVRRTGQPFRLDPMPPARRRLVHQALAKHPDVETVSEGEGPARQVVVRPRSPPPR